MIEKVDQESDEYRKWKEGSATSDTEDKNAGISTEETIDGRKIETNTTSKETIDGRKIEANTTPEETIDKYIERQINKSFFDRTFKVINDTDRMKKTYYFIMALIYYCFCYLCAYDMEGRPEITLVSVVSLIFVSLFFAIIFPLILVIMGFTVSGGAFIGIFVGIFSWIFGVLARFIYKLLGFDIEVIFPELIGKTGKISKHSLLGKFAPYPFTAEMENMGIYGDSIFYKNRFSVRSDQELKIGMQIEVIKHEKRTFTSFVKNHPTFLVKVLNEGNKEKI